MINNILLDMDGVLADFFTVALRELNRKYPDRAISIDEYRKNPTFDIAEKFKISNTEFWTALNYIGFWSNLPLFNHAKNLFGALKEIAPVTIASSPCSSNFNCVPEKLIWLKRHFGLTSSECLFGSRKYLMARPDTLLVDDYNKNTTEFQENGGKAILIPSNWNYNIEKIDIVEYVKREIQKLV